MKRRTTLYRNRTARRLCRSLVSGRSTNYRIAINCLKSERMYELMNERIYTGRSKADKRKLPCVHREEQKLTTRTKTSKNVKPVRRVINVWVNDGNQLWWKSELKHRWRHRFTNTNQGRTIKLLCASNTLLPLWYFCTSLSEHYQYTDRTVYLSITANYFLISGDCICVFTVQGLFL